MNPPTAADILRAESDLLLALKPILIASVSLLVAIVAFGIWRLCAGCPATAALKRCATLVGVVAFILLTDVAQALRPANAGLKPRATTEGAQSGNDLFQQALAKERAEGKVEEAIAIYARVVKEFTGDRPLAAKALLQLARCYEKLGRREARATYERIVREYADQAQPAADAGAWLAAGEAAGSKATVPTTRRVRAGGGNAEFWGDSVSPDGRFLSGTDWSTGDVAVKDLGSGVSRRLTAKGSWKDSPEFAEFSAISPDGSRIAYGWANKDGFYELRLIGSKGGQPRILYRNEEVSVLQPFEWSPDGSQILASFSRLDKTNQLVLVSSAEGSVRVLKTFDWRQPWKAAFSPDGRYVTYDFPPGEETLDRDLFLIAVDGSREVPIVTHRAHDFLLGWMPRSDRVLFASDRTGSTGAWTIRVDNGRPRGDAELAKPNIGHVLAMNFTRAGDYYYHVSTGLRDVYVAARDPATGSLIDALTPLKARSEEGKLAGVWSPDGGEMAYLLQSPVVRGGEGANMLAIHTVDTGRIQTLPLKMSYAQRLRWIPDGRALVVQGTDLKGRRGLFRIGVSTGDFEPIVYGPIVQYAVDPTGRRLFYMRGAGVVVRDLQSGQEAEVHRVASGTGAGLSLSPDGESLALKLNRSQDGGRPSVQILPAAGGEPRTLVTLPDVDPSTWRELTWSPDGRFVLFTKSHGELWQIPAAGGTPEKLAANLLFINSISIHPDGRRIAVSQGSAKYEIWVMENIAPPAQRRADAAPRQ
jgi:Tol biopolymer transport system component